MDDSKPPGKAAHLLDDLESIRALLDNSNEPPLLTDRLDAADIPLLSDVVLSAPAPSMQTPTTSPAAPALNSHEQHAQLSRLTPALRTAAQLILQDVIDDFVPQIEAEVRRRLEARLDKLLPTGKR